MEFERMLTGRTSELEIWLKFTKDKRFRPTCSYFMPKVALCMLTQKIWMERPMRSNTGVF